MTVKRTILAAMAWAASGFAAQAAAQEIILYEHSNYRGREVRVTGPVSNLTQAGFNDRTSSFRILSGQWEICQHDNFRGTCQYHSSDQPSMGRMNDQLTSLRPVASPGGHGPGGYYPGGHRGGGITLYSGPNFTGRSVTLSETTPDFTRIGFNDEARSISFDGRRSWRVCQHANFGGACMEVDRDMPYLGGGMAGQISSAEPDYRAYPGRGAAVPRSGVFLYDGVNFNGQRIDVAGDVDNLERAGFNDRADSVIIAPGERWVLCQHEDYGGRCEVFEGEVRDLSRYGLRNEITSLYRYDGYWGGPGGGYPGPGGRGAIRGGVPDNGTLYFSRPEINGYAVDRCMTGYGRDCGRETAEHICRSAGYRRVEHFDVDRYNRARTWHLGENRACTGQCTPIVDVLCTH